MTTLTSAKANPLTEASWLKLAFWVVLYQIGWFWSQMPRVVNEGALIDTDDYQRLSEVRAWMGGQGWYDLVNHRMNPPAGADMHWSRLVDVPLWLLIRFFDLFTDTVTAERLVTIVWPALLLIATVLVVVAICRRLDPQSAPLLALLFTVTCITALSEFMPGRIDHHSVQILLFSLMLLGIVSGRLWWGHLLLGAAIAASISVGLDAILIIPFLLAWVGLDWCLGRDSDGRGLMMTGLGLAVATPVLYVLNIAPSQWLVMRCDANSSFYFLALMLAAGSFALLSLASARLPGQAGERFSIAVRICAGATVGALAVATLFSVYPECLGGPLAQVSDELKTKWLVDVGEARGLFEQLASTPRLWISTLAYSVLLLITGAYVVHERYRDRPEILVLYATLAISILSSILQFRTLRIGIFASIPLCALFVQSMWTMIRARFEATPLRQAFLQTAVVVIMSSPAWIVLSIAFIPHSSEGKAAGTSASRSHEGWRADDPHIFCNRESDYAAMAALEPGLVMSDLNIGPAVPVFTHHTVVGGPYHRNERAILDTRDFFRTDVQTAERITRERGIKYVAFCEDVEPLSPNPKRKDALAVQIVTGKEPAWLERISHEGERMHLFRVRLP